MKKLLFLLTAILFFSDSYGQSSNESRRIMEEFRNHEMKSWDDYWLRSQNYRGDENIDVKFYHLDIEIAIDSSYILGNVICRFTPTIDDLDELSLDLNRSLSVTAISEPCESFYQDGDQIIISLDENYQPGDLIDLTISYEGEAVMAGGYKGLRYETHGNDEPIIATLSTPFLAHYWYPCKDGPIDKPDSVYVDITIEHKIVNGHEMRAVSNGVLENESIDGNKKTFYWRHRYPIVTYYVMAAISNYVHFDDEFESITGDNVSLDYYVFNEDLLSQQQGVENMPEAINFFESVFGQYPFLNEKYGMTQLGYYGAIENQTNTITNSMEPNWFMVSVHELAHMWFADMITCESWNHAWVNEGFATYAEALWVENDEGTTEYFNYMDDLEFFDGGTIYLENPLDTFNVFTGIIYHKGAWALHMLRGVVGDSLFFESLHNYANDTNFVYKTATTEDLQNVFENTCNTDLTYYFDQWIYDEYYPIYHYNFVQLSNKLFVTLYQAQEELFNRRPVFTMPVKIKVGFTDGSDTIVTAWNDQQLQQFEFTIDKNVNSVQIDPDKWILRKVYFKGDLPVSIEEDQRINDIRLYPNPFNNTLSIDFKEADLFPYEFKLYESSGKLVHCQIITSSPELINTEKLNSGLYFYHISGKELSKPLTGKIIKE